MAIIGTVRHKRSFGVYNWDTFFADAILIYEADTLDEAIAFVTEHYGNRISQSGTDVVKIANRLGYTVWQRTVS